ncbi:MAG: hypothetical protein VSS52_008215, partial [Thiotrichaceae bacterium]|nr:hypothetical protein [Thiotrichaceae bacterium]
MKYNFWWIFGLLLFLSNYTYATDSCNFVAKIQKWTDIEQITIIRNEKVLIDNTRQALCTGDAITVFSKQPIFIYYYNEWMSKEQLPVGKKYIVKQLQSPCGRWCKLKAIIESQYLFLTQREVYQPPVAASSRGDEAYSMSSSFTKDQFAYLFSGTNDIHFFWEGGTQPYNLIVQNQDGNSVVKQNNTSIQEVQFTLPNTEIEQEYTLILHDKDDNEFKAKLVFRTPPLPMKPNQNKLEYFAILLSDPKRSWRLQVWQELQSLPETKEVK